MRHRLLGPYRGYFVSVTCLAMGELGDRFRGWGKIFAHPAESTLSAGELHSLSCDSDHPSIEAALDDAEDQLCRYIDQQLPPAEAPPAPQWPLSCMLYVSRPREPVSVPQLHTLLANARRRNQQWGVTGALLYFDGVFMQYLEGPQPHVQMIYRIIRQDALHTGHFKLVDERLQQRVFGEWAMAFEMPGAALWMPAEKRPQLQAVLGPTTITALLAAFARHRQA